MINPGTRDCWVGVLGGGQLGRMLALEARRMGFLVLKWTGGDVSGAAYTADLVLEAPFDAPVALDRFVDRVQVATVEFENAGRITRLQYVLERDGFESTWRIADIRDGDRGLVAELTQGLSSGD